MEDKDTNSPDSTVSSYIPNSAGIVFAVGQWPLTNSGFILSRSFIVVMLL